MDLTKSCKVLVVEDEGLIAHDISTRLEALGHTVVGTASTAEEAFEKAALAEVVLMDIRIDGPTDGIEAAKLIRERYHLPVIFLTAHADRATVERAKLTGPFGYLVKPLAQGSLNSAIEIAVHKHHIERRLEESEALLRTTLGSVADAILVTDHRGRVLMLNSEASSLTGWTQEQASGQPVLSVLRLIDSDSGEPLDDPVPVAILRDAPVKLDRGCRMLARDGRELRIEGSVAPVNIPRTAVGAVITFRDVSARLWEDQQLRQAQTVDAAGRFAASVSSEYANLLALIRNRADQLMTQFGEYSPARTPVEEIHQAASAAEALTRRLQGFGGRQMSQMEELSLNGILRRMSKLIESIAGSRVELAIRPSPDAGKIKGDAAQIEQAVMNLVMHACARMITSPGDRGQLLVETRSIDLPHAGMASTGYAMLAITHTGREANLENLFEPASTSETGLALAIVHEIVTEHGGYISAHGTAEGGSRYEMLLPRTTGTLTPGAGSPDAPTILFVDHRDRVRAQLHNFFEAQGYNLLEASDEQEARALGEVHEGALDLLIADVREAHRIAAALAADHPRLQVLRVTEGKAGEGKSGPDLIGRPFTQAELLEKVSALIGEKRVAATFS